MRRFWTRNRRNIATSCAIISATCAVIGLTYTISEHGKPNYCQVQPDQPYIEQELDVTEKTQLELPDSN